MRVNPVPPIVFIPKKEDKPQSDPKPRKNKKKEGGYLEMDRDCCKRQLF